MVAQGGRVVLEEPGNVDDRANGDTIVADADIENTFFMIFCNFFCPEKRLLNLIRYQR